MHAAATTPAPHMKPDPRAGEPVAALSYGLLIGAVTAAAILCAGLWLAVVNLFAGFSTGLAAGLAGLALVWVVAIVSVTAMTPWKQRRMGDWMTIWLAATVGRLLITPVAAFLLYSAAFKDDARSLGLAVGLGYVITLFVEAGTLAWDVHRRLESVPSSSLTTAEAQTDAREGE